MPHGRRGPLPFGVLVQLVEEGKNHLEDRLAESK